MNQRSSRGRPPAFIGGFRSGSTLLINLLGLHPQVAPWFETKCLCEALRWIRVLNQPQRASFESQFVPTPLPQGFTPAGVFDAMQWHMHYTAQRVSGQVASGKAAHERYPIGPDCVLYSLEEAEKSLGRWFEEVQENVEPGTVARATGRLIEALGSRQAQLAGRPYWINKTPEIARFGKELRQSLGRCRIIHLIRDGREVALSGARLGWAGIEQMAAHWKGMIELSREAALEAPDDYLEVRFEALIDDPVPTLDRILAFLELPTRAERLWEEYLSGLGNAPPRPQSPARQLAGTEQEIFDRIAGGLLRELGYK